MWVHCCFSYHILFRKFTRPRRKYSNCQRSLNPTPVCVVTAPPQFCFSFPALFLRSVSTRYYTMSNYFYCDHQWKTCVCSFDTHKKNKKKQLNHLLLSNILKARVVRWLSAWCCFPTARELFGLKTSASSVLSSFLFHSLTADEWTELNCAIMWYGNVSGDNQRELWQSADDSGDIYCRESDHSKRFDCITKLGTWETQILPLNSIKLSYCSKQRVCCSARVTDK